MCQEPWIADLVSAARPYLTEEMSKYVALLPFGDPQAEETFRLWTSFIASAGCLKALARADPSIGRPLLKVFGDTLAQGCRADQAHSLAESSPAHVDPEVLCSTLVAHANLVHRLHEALEAVEAVMGTEDAGSPTPTMPTETR